jgi:sulfoquinovosyltransferase
LPNFRLAEGIVWWLIQICHGFADLTLVTSSQIQREFASRRIPRVDVWRKGINTERFHPRHKDPEARSVMTAGNPDDFLIVYVGRLAAEKRVMDLKGILDASPPNTRLCFVGTGPLEAELKQMFAGTKAVFTGQLRGEKLSKAFASADVMVFPSDSETLGFVVLEAMASGTPVVAAHAGGIPDMVDNGVTSFLVPTGHISKYVEKVNLLREDNFRSEMGRRAREEAEKWNWDSSIAYLRNVQYQKAMKNYQQRFGVRAVNWFRRSDKQVKQQ